MSVPGRTKGVICFEPACKELEKDGPGISGVTGVIETPPGGAAPETLSGMGRSPAELPSVDGGRETESLLELKGQQRVCERTLVQGINK